MGRKFGLDGLSKSYDPGPIEGKWYARWIEDGIFGADAKSDKPSFSIVIPPPNVTGSLHLGHALDNTLQDILCRTKRMQGFNVLWMPGTDHAGIATQNVVERALRSEGKSREDLGREAFVSRVWEWKEEYGGRIINQLKKLGASCDWDRERFTMDEGLSRAVRKVFVELYKKGLIYRGKYLINWCPRCLTALSDLEVEHKELEGRLYSVKYVFRDGGGALTVMTTRPETILGDVAIAVHPRDERNRHLVGREVAVPLCGRVIPVIEDNLADPEFGTGALKITPAHDPNDFLVGLRHGLEQIQVIDDRGRMNENGGKYAGLDRAEAREAIAMDLRDAGLLAGEERYTHSVGHCYRCGTVIEPYLSEQWFVRTRPLADVDVAAVKRGDIRFVPDQWAATYYQWMENIRDWCISRQLWWGHRIPAWYCDDCGGVIVSVDEPKACACGGILRQDEDVLDTWFSSALWPFSTMGWPDETDLLRTFYPTSVLVTGFDIIFFWVARMIMMGEEFMQAPPFRDVYIHALVRDEKGQKMSKSKGNVIDPLDIIGKFGADALRLTLAALTVQGRDIFLSESRIETYRFFMNKLWNASRFALMNLEGSDIDFDGPDLESRIDVVHLRVHDRWILSRLSGVTAEMTRLIDGYFFGESARLMYDFVWGELCDWYLELSKPALRGDEGPGRRAATQVILYIVFRDVLKLLHPVIPFTTEELWSAFGYSDALIGRSRWPVSGDVDGGSKAEEEIGCLQAIVRAMRNLRAEVKIPPQQSVPRMCLRLKDESRAALVEDNSDLASLLTKVEKIEMLGSGAPKPARCLSFVTGDWELFFPVGDLLDVAKELSRLRGELSKLDKETDRVRGKLSNPNFLDRAPAEVVEKERDALAESESRMRRIEENISGLE
ncbi:MAG: valine--tRNA ligase [Synergistaceae bacterium]|jgi:valyl-tRNA synthetase|nr:valine--tRNA ligase [Synergistaceae bacterium]